MLTVAGVLLSSVTLHSLMLAQGAGPAKQDQLTIEPSSAVVCAGDSASFSAGRGKASVEVSWTIEPSERAGVLKPENQTPVVNYTAPAAIVGKDRNNGFAPVGVITLTATWTGKDAGDDKKTASA
jgi:hypothetical protein